ncbi:MAG: Alternate 30S ribosomal protein S14 [Chlamydiia bacterium]|nr:Alternate 30S ribosomal protein S14 [Chlamydiia bacterium]
MAKKSAVHRDLKRRKCVERNREKREELKKLVKQGDQEAMFKLARMSRNASPTRVHNRCSLTGRPRGYLRKYGISRIAFREMALKGHIPGVIKASW